MTFDELSRLLREPSRADSQHLSDLMLLSQQYPYCAPLHLLILSCLHRTGDLRFASELHKRILYITDPKALFFALKELDTASSTKKVKVVQENDERPLDSFDIVSSFLEDHPDDTTEIEQMLDNLRSSDMTPEEGNDATDERETTQEDIINDFLSLGSKAEEIAPIDVKESEDTEESSAQPQTIDTEPGKDDELLTETLARIYIGQGKFEQALRIFNTLNLKYSKKNSYFAEQIAFLEKLVRNSTK